MNHTSPNSTGRIMRHGSRADDATDEAVENRARELALIDGRSPHRLTQEDLALARDELAGRRLPETTLEDARAIGGMSHDPADPRGIAGQQTPMRNEPEDQETAERLALEGVEEAAHEQMLADRRRNRDEP